MSYLFYWTPLYEARAYADQIQSLVLGIVRLNTSQFCNVNLEGLLIHDSFRIGLEQIHFSNEFFDFSFALHFRYEYIYQYWIFSHFPCSLKFFLKARRVVFNFLSYLIFVLQFMFLWVALLFRLNYILLGPKQHCMFCYHCLYCLKSEYASFQILALV